MICLDSLSLSDIILSFLSDQTLALCEESRPCQTLLTDLTAYLPRGGEPEEGLPERCELLSAHVEDDHGLAADVVAAVRLLLRQDMAGSIFIVYIII